MARERSARTYWVKLAPQVTRNIPEDFLSFAVDTSLVLGGHWWGKTQGTTKGLARDRIAELDLGHADLGLYTSLLAPAVLRVGGTEADRIHYGFRSEGPDAKKQPHRQGLIFKKSRWKALCRFAVENGLRLLFTVGAGPESRDDFGQWQPEGAERLLTYTGRKNLEVFAWEFGNEVNAYPLLFGMRNGLSARHYAKDFETFAQLVHKLTPEAKVVGPASAIWPIIGEPHPILPRLCQSRAAGFVDALSFHYYPQQSSRGRLAVRRAKSTTLFSPRVLDGARRWVNYVRRSAGRGAASTAPLWVTETGHALYGGEPGVSDTWLSTPWWLDQLGLLATEGVERVFRQALIGGDYGLLDQETYEPRPDFYASFLWKRLIGTGVYPQPNVTGPDRRLRAWHFSGQNDASWVLVINLNLVRKARVELEKPILRALVLEPDGQRHAGNILLNGQPVTPDLATNWNKKSIRSRYSLDTPLAASVVMLPPLACAFLSTTSP